jgi:hypothetical protein
LKEAAEYMQALLKKYTDSAEDKIVYY